jgi:diguanylate cyclase (GGDEF)-like protein/PAS domain S-box-containing protein
MGLEVNAEVLVALLKRLQVLSVSKSVESLLGYKPEDLISSAVLLEDLIHPHDAEDAARLFSPTAQETEGEASLRMRRSDGRILCVHAQFTREFKLSGEVLVRLKLRDARELMRSGSRRRAAIHLPAVMECVDESVYLKDLNHVITLANRNYRLMLSESAEDLRDVAGLTDYDLFPEAVADELYALEARVMAGAPVAHAVLETEDARGRQEWLDIRKFPVRDAKGEIVSIFSIQTEITEGVRGEQALRASEESLKEAQRLAGLGSYVLDIRRRTWSASEVLDEIFGIAKGDEHTIESWTEIVHPVDREQMAAYFAEEVLGKRNLFNREYRIRRKSDGRVLWVHGLGRLEFDNEGAPLGMRGTIQDITERKQADAALRESRELLQLFIDHAPAALAMFDREMRYLAASQRWIGDFRLQGQQILGRSHYQVFPEIPENWKEAHKRGLAGEGVRADDDRFERADGSVQWLRWELIPWRAADGSVGGIVLFAEDITSAKASEERLHLAASVFTHASEGIVITDAEGAILDVNDAFTRITGYTRSEVLGRNPSFLKSGRQNGDFYAEMWRHLEEVGHWSGEIWNRAKSGLIFAEMLTINAVPDAEGNTKQYVALFSDITFLKEQEKQLKRIAHYDLLTGLPNRVLLADRLHQAMAQSHRSGRQVAIACLDLDDFRAINDDHGHNTGDQLLTEITRRMSGALREGDTLARLGGDEFVAVMLEIDSIEDSLPLVEGLIKAVAEPVELGELSLHLSTSVGLTSYPQAEDVDADQLLRQADQAMYHAKLAGKGRYHIFDPKLDRSLRGHHEDLKRIREALRTDEFVLHFQPRVNMRTGTVSSAEALIRWQHPERGLLAPAQFLPIVAGNPLVVELGDWVLRNALKQVARWRAEGLEIAVSVNIDALQLQQDDFVDGVGRLLAAHPTVSPSQLELEVLESGALQDIDQVSRVIRACTRMGVTFALDDFGTGYSSLSYLKRLPVHFLKIDQTFVHDMLDDPEDLTILEGVLGLANAFRREAVAEGVETMEHGLTLLRLGCQLAQGYGIARPMAGTKLATWAACWKPDPQWATAKMLNPSDRPLLYASVEHRAWVASIEESVKGHFHTAPLLDEHLCRFGAWLDTETASGRGAHAEFRQMVELHHRLHAFALGVIAHKTHGDDTAAHDALADLHGLRDELLKQLTGFVQRY